MGLELMQSLFHPQDREDHPCLAVARWVGVCVRSVPAYIFGWATRIDAKRRKQSDTLLGSESFVCA